MGGNQLFASQHRVPEWLWAPSSRKWASGCIQGEESHSHSVSAVCTIESAFSWRWMGLQLKLGVGLAGLHNTLLLLTYPDLEEDPKCH